MMHSDLEQRIGPRPKSQQDFLPKQQQLEKQAMIKSRQIEKVKDRIILIPVIPISRIVTFSTSYLCFFWFQTKYVHEKYRHDRFG